MPNLEEILGESYSQIPEDIRNKYKEVNLVNSLEYIEKTKFEGVNTQLSDLQSQLKDRDKQLKDLSGKVGNNEELKKQLENLQGANKKASEEYESKIRNLTLDGAITNLLKDNKAKYTDLLMSKFDRDKLNIKEDGSIEGLEDQFKGISETYKDLFEQPLSGKTPPNLDDKGGNKITLESQILQGLRGGM